MEVMSNVGALMSRADKYRVLHPGTGMMADSSWALMSVGILSMKYSSGKDKLFALEDI